MFYGDQEGRSNIGSRADDGQEGRSEPREESDKSAANGNSDARSKHALVGKEKTGDEKQMTNGLAVITETKTDHLSHVQRLGTMLAASGYFSDVRDTAQAAVKVMAGEELGIAPIAAVMGINIIKGKVTLSGNLIASLVRRHGYDYRHKQFDNKGCVLEFYGKDKSILGESSFTEDDARLAGVFSDMYKKYPRNMFFNRAISNGAKWYCPEVTSGLPVYVPEELGASIDSEGNVEEPTKEAMAQAAQEVAKRKIAEKKAKPEPAVVDVTPLAISGPDMENERTELTNQVRAQLTAMAPAYDAADPKSMAAYKRDVTALQMDAFGVPSWKSITTLPLEVMRAGLACLTAKENTTHEDSMEVKPAQSLKFLRWAHPKPEDSLEPIWSDIYKMLADFKQEKARVGEVAYREVLNQFGVTKSNQFKTSQAGIKCFIALRSEPDAAEERGELQGE